MWNENMELTTRTLPAQKHIALVAHDHCKDMLMKWVARHQALLAQHILYANGTTGNLVSRATGLEVNAMLSGPMGGDQQVGALISEDARRQSPRRAPPPARTARAAGRNRRGR